MKKIGNKFSIVGTNPNKYIENYLNCFFNVPKLDEIKIIRSSNSLFHQYVELISFDSYTTLRQNIDCWVGLGFFARNGNKLIKIIDNMKEEYFYEHIKTTLLVETDIENINIYRDTILIKLMDMMNLETIKRFNLSTRTKTIIIDDIKKEIGKFEKLIFNDKTFRKILEIMWGENNE